jgi:hypothetical protein
MAMQQIMGGMQQGGNPLQAPEMTPSWPSALTEAVAKGGMTTWM